MNRHVELLAPAGDLDKLKLAFEYGADAVYIGGKAFSLRYFASNFTFEDIKEGIKYAHERGKKVYVACNMVMHEEESINLEEYLIKLKEAEVDAVIISSLYALNLAVRLGIEAHMSTQLSILNSEAVSLFKSLGASRVVLAREANLEEINSICSNVDVETEVFIHGGMCSSFSGKCMLSKEMSNRDPNRGGCAHSCRWKYHFYQNGQKMFPDDKYFSMSSKDLCALKEVTKLINSGVTSLKIEGRMKSYHYLASIISSYRLLIDAYYAGEPLFYEKYMQLIRYGENRLTGHGFFYGNVTKEEMLLNLNDEFERAGEFVAIVREYDPANKIAKIEIKNKILVNNKYLVISPHLEPEPILIKAMRFKDEEITKFTVAGEIIEIEVDKDLHPFDLIRII